MLGSPKPRRLAQPIAVSLEDLVPQDHFYRHLEAKLDLGFVVIGQTRACLQTGLGGRLAASRGPGVTAA